MLSAIIVAAGSSRRAGFDKLFAPLAGKPVLAHSLSAFENSDIVDEVVLVGRCDRLQEIRALAGHATKLRAVVTGGEHRQDSVAAGFQALSSDAQFVAIHDAARPLVTAQLIDRVFAACKQSGAASAAVPVSDTLKRADEHYIVRASIDRSNLFAMQTPQIFQRDLIQEAYRAVARAGMQVTDEVSAVQLIGREVLLVPADDHNPKITFPRDLEAAEALLRLRHSQ